MALACRSCKESERALQIRLMSLGSAGLRSRKFAGNERLALSSTALAGELTAGFVAWRLKEVVEPFDCAPHCADGTGASLGGGVGCQETIEGQRLLWNLRTVGSPKLDTAEILRNCVRSL